MIVTYLFGDEAEVAQALDRGCALMGRNRFAEAIEEFDNVLKIDPDERYSRWNRAVAQLALGDYANGMPGHNCAWDLYDWRALGQVEGNIDRLLVLPLWHGERCKLIAYHEKGFGDAIMTLRFLPELVADAKA